MDISDVIKNSEFYKSHGLYHDLIVLQPTTFCNLDCEYCYLPDRANKSKMDPAVAYRVAEGINGPTTILWHSGEPMATGIDQFRRLLRPFQDLQGEIDIGYSMQTNATLVTEEWAKLLKENNFNVGVSIDGPEELTKKRVNRAGRPMFEMIIRGMEILRENGIAYSVLAVVREETADRARDIYEFAREYGAKKLAINFEEVEGVHPGGGFQNYNFAKKFWSELYEIWKEDRTVPVREFVRIHDRFNRTIARGSLPPRHSSQFPIREISLLPTIAVNGDVTLLSPEFVGIKQFAIGNVLADPLEKIIERGLKASFVSDFAKALEMCKSECRYFDFCGGGFPSNRYSEHGRIDVHETDHCRVHDQALVEAVLEGL